MTRPRRLLLWAGLTGLLFLGMALSLHAGEGRLLAGFVAGFLAAVLLYFLYPLSSDPEPGPEGPPPTAAETVAAPPNPTLDGMLQRPGSNESMLNVILNSMGEGVLLLNQADRVVLMNPSAEKVLGLQARDARGRHYLEVLRHPVLSDLLARAKSGEGLATGELEFSARDERTFAVSAAAIRVEGGALLGQIMVFSDITSLKKLMRMRTDFAANVSHELKTPLTAILGYVETLLAGAIDDKKNRVQFLGKISAQAQRLHALIADVLQLSAIESGSYLEASEAVDLSEVAQQAVELLKAKWEARGIRVVQEVPAGRKVWGQKEGLFHVVENLLDNA
ncbi:MAG TPA: histidine kinase dimerization/phospho-acceptor domain-containing protein, partial [bacterium]|nr:histidine kinase dimerization/phospho-acceptor domain-containing protein [bacterium]